MYSPMGSVSVNIIGSFGSVTALYACAAIRASLERFGSPPNVQQRSLLGDRPSTNLPLESSLGRAEVTAKLTSAPKLLAPCDRCTIPGPWLNWLRQLNSPRRSTGSLLVFFPSG